MVEFPLFYFEIKEEYFPSMIMEVEKVFLTNEFSSQDEDYYNTHTDVVVQLDSGEKYIASFFTFQNMESIRKANLKSGSYLNGKYFWKKNMVLIDKCEKDSIQEVIKHLMEEGDFKSVFQLMSE